MPTSESCLNPPIPGPCPARGSTTMTGGLSGNWSGPSRDAAAEPADEAAEDLDEIKKQLAELQDKLSKLS